MKEESTSSSLWKSYFLLTQASLVLDQLAALLNSIKREDLYQPYSTTWSFIILFLPESSHLIVAYFIHPSDVSFPKRDDLASTFPHAACSRIAFRYYFKFFQCFNLRCIFAFIGQQTLEILPLQLQKVAASHLSFLLKGAMGMLMIYLCFCPQDFISTLSGYGYWWN